MKTNKIVILHKKGQPVFNNPIWYLKGQYAMMLFTNRDKEYIASESRMREEIPGGRRQKETFCTVIWAGKVKNPPETRIFRRILLSELLKYKCTVALSTDRRSEELFKCLLEVSHILGACSLIRGVHS